ncbi:unnamed protein product [Ilex paraguariensis]|uniref:Uncharacterized protein n=1 Tax=Ilex paraguariensis TaxID=185542 RepID=A0ABC8TUK3_9AQUA
MPTLRKEGEHESLYWYDDHVSFMPDFDSPRRIHQSYTSYHHQYSCKQELELQYTMPHESFHQLPQLESPKVAESMAQVNCNSMAPYNFERHNLLSSTLAQEHLQQSNQLDINLLYSNNNEHALDQVTDWRVLDKFVASQLSQEDATKESTSFQVAENMNMLINGSKRQEMASEYAAISSSSCHIDLWK